MRLAALVSLFALVAGPTFAAVEACDRVTHASHGGSDQHRDMGRGKVLWVDWWAQEGVSKDVWLADCRSGVALSLRNWEERMGERHVIDRTDKVVAAIAHQAETAPAFLTIDRVAPLVRGEGADMLITVYGDEFCACNVAYPELRGSKTSYEVTP